MVKSLEPLRVLLFILGIKPLKNIKGIQKVLYQLYTYILYTVYVVYATLLLVTAYIARFDHTLFSQYMYISLYALKTTLEDSYTRYNKQKLIIILNKIENNYKNYNDNFSNYIKEKSKKREFFFMKMILALQIPVFVITFVVFMLKEVTYDDMKLNSYLKRENPEKTILFVMWLPFDDTIEPYHTIIFSYVNITLTICSIIMHLYIVLIPIVAIHLQSQFEVICHLLENMEYKYDKQSGKYNDNNNYCKIIHKDSCLTFREIIKGHQNLLR